MGRARHWLGVVAATAVLTTAAPAAAGPWAPEPGHGYVKLWLKYLYGFGYHDGDGNDFGYGAYHEVFVNAYAELGLIDRVGLVLHAPLLRSFHLEDPRDGSYSSFVSPGDPTLALRWQFLQIDRFVAAVDAGVTFPFARAGPVQTVYGTDPNNPALGELRIGTGVWDVPLNLGVGYAWDEWYVAASVGYVVRTDGYDHVLTWTAEGGATLERQFGFRGRVVGYHSLDVYFGAEAPLHQSPSGIGSGSSYIGFAIECDWQIEPGWFLGVTAEGALGLIVRQTGGPVVTGYLARRF